MDKRIVIMKDCNFCWVDLEGIQIALSDRNFSDAGTKKVSQERLDEIRDGIQRGSIVGLPTYTYWNPDKEFHYISTTPFPASEHDHECGFVYYDMRITDDHEFDALEGLRKYVTDFNTFISDEVYSFVVEERVYHRGVNQTTLEEEWQEKWIEIEKGGGFFKENPFTNGMLPKISPYLKKGYKLIFD